MDSLIDEFMIFHNEVLLFVSNVLIGLPTERTCIIKTGVDTHDSLGYLIIICHELKDITPLL